MACNCVTKGRGVRGLAGRLDERADRDALRVRSQRLRDARRQELPAHHHRAAAAGEARRDLESVLESSHGMLRR